jgi:hypothetical protein
MKTILTLLFLSVLLSSCALNTKTGTATLDPDAETVRAVNELVHTVLNQK